VPFVLRARDGNTALRAFHAALSVQLREVGLGKFTTAAFEPHVTLAYDVRMIAPHEVAPIAWRAHEFVLVHSLLGKTQQVVLDRWPLD
jgi:2'-5' RNA ligase